MQRLSLLTVLAALPLAALADPGTLEGIVFEAGTGRPLPDVDVVIEGEASVKTDAEGAFRIELEPGTWTVQLRSTTFADGSVGPLTVADGGVTEALITLSPDQPPLVDAEQPDSTEAAVTTEAPEVVGIGTLAGRIENAKGKGLAGARVYIAGQSVEGLTDDDGRFELELPAGSHRMSVLLRGYTTFTASDIEVTADTRTEYVAEMVEAALALPDVTVSAPYIQGSTASLLDERRKSAAVADVLGAEEMSRSGDSNAASALRRVTGLTVVDGKYVFVRGLGDRYSSSLLNGSTLPSPEPEKRVVPLDLFPSAMLESVVVQKSYSPDMPGEFGGGVVQLRTRRVPDAAVLEVGMAGRWRQGTSFQKGLSYDTGPWDWLGADMGHRALPDEVLAASENSPLEEGDLFSERGYTSSELEALGEAMDSNYATRRVTIPLDHGFNIVGGNNIERGNNRIGWLLSGNYGRGWDNEQYDQSYFAISSQGVEPSHVYAFDGMQMSVNTGLMGVLGFELGDNHTVTLNSVNVRSTDDETRIYEGLNRDVGDPIRVTRLRYIERQLLFQQLLGDHTLPTLGHTQIEWRAAYANARRLEPDRREYRQDLEPATGDWLLSDRPEGNQRFFSALADHNVDLGIDITVPFKPDDLETGSVKFGAAHMQKTRGVDTRRFKYFHKGENSRDQDILAMEMNDIFVPENIGPDGFQFEEFTRQTDNYTASQQVTGVYAMTEMNLLPWLRWMGGARLEAAEQVVTTFALFSPDSEPVEARLKTLDPLPATSLTVKTSEKTQLRGSYGRTVSRPDFRELSPATFNDVTGGRQTFGNPDLQRALIDHADLRWEWYPSAGESLSFGGFYKQFHDPIESVVVVSAQQSVSYDNAEGATNMGLEFDARKDLVKHLFVAGNVAIIRSQIQLAADSGIQTNNERPLQGQSPYVVNVQLGYDNEDGDRVTLLYNHFGRRIEEVGAQGAPDTYQLSYGRMDLVASKRITDAWSASLKANNLTNPREKITAGAPGLVDQPFETYNFAEGMSVQLGIKWKPLNTKPRVIELPPATPPE